MVLTSQAWDSLGMVSVLVLPHLVQIMVTDPAIIQVGSTEGMSSSSTQSWVQVSGSTSSPGWVGRPGSRSSSTSGEAPTGLNT